MRKKRYTVIKKGHDEDFIGEVIADSAYTVLKCIHHLRGYGDDMPLYNTVLYYSVKPKDGSHGP